MVAVVLAAVTIGALAVIITTAPIAGHRETPRPSAVAAHRQLPGLARSSPVRPALAPVPAPLVVADGSLPTTAPEALFVGASYTAGLGAQPATEGYAYQTAALLGWRAEVDGEPGTGYLNAGPHGGSPYLARLRVLIPPATPDIIVFQSGRNDIGYPLGELHDAVRTAVDEAHSRWPSAKVVILGAIPADLPLTPGILSVESTLAQAARDADAPFIDPIAQNWITATNEHRYTGAVPQHPSNTGYAYLASRLAPELRAEWQPATPATSDQTA